MPRVAAGCAPGHAGPPGQYAGSCGGAEAACCEAQGAVTSTNWQFVGPGNGIYNSVQSYQFVGQGCGSFDKEVTTTYYGWKVRKCCIGVACMLFIPTLLYLLLMVTDTGGEGPVEPSVPPPALEISTPAPSPAPETRPLYRCDRPGLWTLAKKDWCCKHWGRGCPTRPPATTPRPTRPVVVPQPVPVPAPVPHPVPAPSPAPTLAPAPPVTNSLPFDCNADYMTCYHCLMARWSVPKRAWCCAHAHRGCPTSAPPAPSPPPPPPAPVTTSLPYDCNADYLPCYHCLMARWSVGKRAWCCTRAHRGCPTAPPVAPPPSTSSAAYDCGAGYSNWKAGWSAGKKAWCCRHAHRGCPPPAPPATSACPPQDCSAAYANWRAAWTPEKKKWCCEHEHKGCE